MENDKLVSDLLRMSEMNSMSLWKRDVCKRAADALSIPSVDAVEVRHGRWIQKEDKDWAGGGKTLCSKCKYGYSWKMYFEPESFKYCPNCGARMDGSREDGET